MGVLRVTERDDRESTQDSEKTDFKRNFDVYMEERRDGAAQIWASNLLPRILDPYFVFGDEGWTSSLARSRNAKFVGGRNVDDGGEGWKWEIAYSYSTKGDGDEDEGEENPLLQPAKIKVRTNRFEKPLEKDLEDILVLNSAGMPFDPPVVKDDARPSIVISRNMPFFNLSFIEGYKDSTNEDNYLGREPYFWKMADISADRAFWDNQGQRLYYWEVEIEIEANENLWSPVLILDRGRYEFGSDSPDPTAPQKLVPIRAGEDNRPVQDPVPLNGEGKQLVADSDPVFLPFKFYRPKSFSAIGIL